MAKRQLDEDLTIEPETVEPAPMSAPQLVQVRALVPMWGNDEVVPVGMVYGLPAEAAAYLVELGMVAIEEAG
jgi:hypothetical protein